jgi:branched-chain amino acid transport system ATP-binding protein
VSTVLQVEDLRAGYGPIAVVNGFDLKADAGGVIAVLGANGAGKTTMLMAIAGFLPGVKGRVLLEGRELTGPAYRRCSAGIGIVLEGRKSIVPSLTTTDNLKVARCDIDGALALFPELEPRMDVKAGQLSGGEQQMLALARAIGRQPRALLIDELSFGLAPIVCKRLFTSLREVGERTEMAIVLVEQHVHFAAEVADRAIVMQGGTVALEMRGSEIRSREAEIEELYLGAASAVASEGDEQARGCDPT